MTSSPRSLRRPTPAHTGVDTWLTDARGDLPEINVRTLLSLATLTGSCPTRPPPKRLRDCCGQARCSGSQRSVSIARDGAAESRRSRQASTSGHDPDPDYDRRRAPSATTIVACQHSPGLRTRVAIAADADAARAGSRGVRTQGQAARRSVMSLLGSVTARAITLMTSTLAASRRGLASERPIRRRAWSSAAGAGRRRCNGRRGTRRGPRRRFRPR